MLRHGTIYFDKSFKRMSFGRPIFHNEYCAEISYKGKRYRKRSRNLAVVEHWIDNMADRFYEQEKEKSK